MTQKRQRRVVGVPEMSTRVLSRKIANISPREILTSFCPVVTSTTLTEDEVIRSEKSAQRSALNRVHGTRLKIDENCAWNILVAADLVVVDGDTLELEVGIALVATVPLDAVLIRYDFPELGT